MVLWMIISLISIISIILSSIAFIKKEKLENIHPKQQMSIDAAKEVNKNIKDGDTLCIFGTGYDSNMWAAMNKNGKKTYFLEHEERWRNKAKSSIISADNVEILPIEYTSRLNDWGTQKVLPKGTLSSKTCDISVVDSPQGRIYGRGQSTMEALRITKPGGLIYLDDAKRSIEGNEVKIINEILRPVCSEMTILNTRDGFLRCKL